MSDIKCVHCQSDKIIVSRYNTSEFPVTGYDEDHGPVYFAECECCLATGPIVGWAADAIAVFIGVVNYREYIKDPENERFAIPVEKTYETFGHALGKKQHQNKDLLS